VNVDVSPGRWAAAGPAGGDTAYRTQSLKFIPMETALDESVPWRTLFALWLRAAIISGTVWVLFFFIWLLTALNSDDSSGSDPSFVESGAKGLLVFGQLVPFALFWALLLLPRIVEPVAEWRTLLENKAPAAGSAYAAVYGSLARRRIPVDTVAMRIRSDVLAPEVVNNRLVLTERSYVAYVSVFPYGTSLYVGWTMFRTRRGGGLIGTYLKDVLGALMGRTGLVNQMLRTEKVRAMREALHSAVREGVEVAVQGIEVPIAATFGQDIPIQDLTPWGPSSTRPVAPPPPPRPVAPPPPPPPAAT
jgi:hypothetical protein